MSKDPVYRAELRLRGQMNVGFGVVIAAVGLGFVLFAPITVTMGVQIAALAMLGFGIFAVGAGISQVRQADSDE